MLYSGRLAKAVQRRMIVEACRRLTAIASLDEYQYLGFGGLEFNDFVDIHNALGIKDMTSIERDPMLKHRVEFNKPYECVTIRFGEARDELPSVDWSRLSIVWLDYTDPLTRNVLRDVDYVVRSCLPGSVVIATVQAFLGNGLEARLAALRANLEELCPDGLTTEDVEGWGVAQIQRDVLEATATSVSREAHGGSFRQLFNVRYADDARMLTWGGVVSAPNVDRTIDACRFDDLPFVRTGNVALEVRVPPFTRREWLHYERESAGGLTPQVLPGITRDEVRAFTEIYRWKAS